MKRSLAVLVAALLLSACGGGSGSQGSASPKNKTSPTATVPPQASASASPTAAASPSPAPTAPPVPVTGGFGVLVSSPSASNYAISLIGPDGKVAASAQASSPTPVTCVNGAAADVPLSASTSNSRAYYMDAQGVVRFLSPGGENGRVTTVPTGSGVRSMFAVSPDDQRIAVVVATYSTGGANTRLYVEDLIGSTNHVDIFSESGAYTLWPVGWHGTTNLVVAKVAACASGGGPFCCGPLELHVVDPATAVRRFTLGGPGCVIAGPPSLAGAVCEDIHGYTTMSILNWTGGVIATNTYTQGAVPILLSPDQLPAIVSSGSTQIFTGARFSISVQACGWIDGTHLLAGGDSQSQPRVGDISNPNSFRITPVAALGDCAGRIPGGL